MKELNCKDLMVINGGIDENRWGAGYGTAACLGTNSYRIYKYTKRKPKKRKARVKGYGGYIPE